ncbi:MAG: hypothetical protein JSV76_01635 [Candidatus Bathyarchaeota archaeon]|nr:MAG: hypothetical protein JSV76_01635 [Candidatus Bathyarchaeota archaeon]
MKSYLRASSLPVVNISQVLIPRLILGHMPFVGESYQGPQKNREYRQTFSDLENTVALLRRSVENHGLTVTTAMASKNELAALFLKGVKKAIQQSGVDVALIPCFQIPLTIDGQPINDYRRWVTYYNIEKNQTKNLLEKYVTDPILLCRTGWRDKFPKAIVQSQPYDRTQIQKLKIDWKKLRNALSYMDGFNVILAELGSESDFLVMTGRFDLLERLRNRVADYFSCPIVLGIHHAGSTIPILETQGQKFAAYVTPVNKLGALMLPTKNQAQIAIRKTTTPIMAIKPLAGGRLQPTQAFQYVYEEMRTPTCMIGVGTKKEMDQDVRVAHQFLSS